MATNKQNVKYKCPYCDLRFTRDNLVIHVEKKHEDMIPEGYSAFRVVFDYINKKPAGYNGKCIICGGESGWNEDKGKYNRICDNPECKKKYIEKFEKNMMDKKGTKRISSTAEGQAKMLANRKISGKYKFKTDGVERTYTGTYEKKTLEFMDEVLKCLGQDVVTPGPIMEYMFEGKKHIYIPDIYYEPYNLIIEVKDGGDNPNNRPMEEYRAKQIAKEDAIVNNTDFNYLRLTNNNFSQLLEVFAELKMQMVDNNIERVIRINENNEIINENGTKYFLDRVEKLSKWMQSNIKYANFTKLMSHDEVAEKKKGSCHDQVMYEYEEIKKLGSFSKGLFFIETNDKGQGGTTHSLVYFKDIKGRIVWFENAWSDYKGLNYFNSLSELKDKIKSEHGSTWGDVNKYPNIEFTIFSIGKHKPGESLQEFIDICFGEKSVKESAMKVDKQIQEAMNALTSGYIPGFRDTGSVYVVNYMQNNVFSGIGLSDNIKLTNLIIRNNEGKLVRVGEGSDIIGNGLYYNIYDTHKSVQEVSELFAPYMNKEVPENFIYETLTGKKFYDSYQLRFDESLTKIENYDSCLTNIGWLTDRLLTKPTPEAVEVAPWGGFCYNYIDEETGLWSAVDRNYDLDKLDTTKEDSFIRNLKFREGWTNGYL